jgi:hypothetical protein
MTLRTWLVLLGTLAAVLAASALLRQPPDPAPDALALLSDGIGPLRLGADYAAAAEAARRAAPATMMAGEGCSGRDEITYSGTLGGLPVTVMAMADDGVINEVEMTLDHPRQAENEAACLALRDRLGEHFVARFGAGDAHWVVKKPVSSEHMLQVGPAVLAARWFSTGRSCYITATFTPPGGADTGDRGD